MNRDQGSKVYVGNLSWNTTDDTLRDAFIRFGQVLDSIVMRDRETGRSRGFGFVTLGSSQEAQMAIDGLNEQELDGRRVKVNLANVRPTNPSSGYQGSGDRYNQYSGGGAGGGGGAQYGGQPSGGYYSQQPAYGGYQ